MRADVSCIVCLQDNDFVWSKQWYPLAAVEDLKLSKPFATKLLGKLFEVELLVLQYY